MYIALPLHLHHFSDGHVDQTYKCTLAPKNWLSAWDCFFSAWDCISCAWDCFFCAWERNTRGNFRDIRCPLYYAKIPCIMYIFLHHIFIPQQNKVIPWTASSLPSFFSREWLHNVYYSKVDIKTLLSLVSRPSIQCMCMYHTEGLGTRLNFAGNSIQGGLLGSSPRTTSHWYWCVSEYLIVYVPREWSV